MLSKIWTRLVRSSRCSQQCRKARRHVAPWCEILAERIAPAVTATFFPQTHTLLVLGDSLNNQIVASRTVAGAIQVNGGAVPIVGGTPTVANTTSIQIFGLAGNDTISLNETNGQLPAGTLIGGAGNDVLTGGSRADTLQGDGGNDTLYGKGGNDVLLGNDGNDTLVGGTGNGDIVAGGDGNDRLVYNTGDQNDVLDGGNGTDTVVVNGTAGADNITVALNGSVVQVQRTNAATFSIDISTAETLDVLLGGGNDTFSAATLAAGFINLIADGGDGNDSLIGSAGNDNLFGGAGDDFIDGNRGTDTVNLGAGNDVFQWDPGDASDSIEGGTGSDTINFHGANANEKFALSANGPRALLTRDVANIAMDFHGIEHFHLTAAGGLDTITINSLAGTDVTDVKIDLAGVVGGTTGDGQADFVTINGTTGADTINVAQTGTTVAVTGLKASVSIVNVDAAFDGLTINGLDGNDKIDGGNALLGGGFVADGGAGDDAINGTPGGDSLIGGDGNDVINGRAGNDAAFLGANDDTFVWNPGDGNDIIEGQAGADRLVFNGSAASESFDLSPNGSRLLLTRDIGSVIMDVNAVERVDVNALGGADRINLGDMTPTGVGVVNVNLAAALGGTTGDSQADQVIVNGTALVDSITATSGPSGISVQHNGFINILGAEPALDRLTINGLAGADTLDASGLQANRINFTLDGGDDADMLIGSQGADTIVGGRGDDVAFMGAGNDTFVWNPGEGSDTVEGQAGVDTLQFNGANVAENIALSANGERVRFTRDVGAVTIDMNDVEHLNIFARGGADTITVNDLSGTDVSEINLDLNAFGGGDDGSVDNVNLFGTAGIDGMVLSGGPGAIFVDGMHAAVNIVGAVAANDHLNVNGLGGNDVIYAATLAADAIQLTEIGDDGNDILIGSQGADTLLGGANDDVLIGGPGADTLDGGTGNNFVQD